MANEPGRSAGPPATLVDSSVLLDLERESVPYQAGFLAAKAFLIYRQRGGQRRSPLPDFYIGAHAALRGYRLLTRDAARYRAYFPSVDLLAPAPPVNQG